MDLWTIRSNVKTCNKCPFFSAVPTQPQSGLGSAKAKVMLITLRATLQAHQYGKPIDERNELLLKKLLDNTGISGNDIYVTSVVKCAGPVKPAKAFNANAQTCISEHLAKEIEVIQPKFLVFFGVTSAKMAGFGEIVTDLPNADTTYITHSFEELYRHGVKYFNHAQGCLKEIGKCLTTT